MSRPALRRGDEAPAAATSRIWVMFSVAGEVFGLPVDEVEEVVSGSELLPAPGAPPAVCGVVEVQGRRLPVVALQSLLGLTDAGPARRRRRVLVVRCAGRRVGLLAGGVRQLLEIPHEAVHELPPAVRTAGNSYLAGLVAQADRWLLLLDVAGLVRAATLGPAAVPAPMAEVPMAEVESAAAGAQAGAGGSAEDHPVEETVEKGLQSMAQNPAPGSAEPSWQDCIAMLDRLPGLGLDERVEVVERLVRNSSPGIRGRALRMGAAVLGDSTLISYLRNDADGVLRNAGLEMLKMRGNRGFSLAIELLRDGDPDVALQAVLVLDHLKDPRALEALRGQLTHDDPNIVQAVILALGRLGDARTIPDLLPFLEADPWLQAAAVEALGDIRSPVAAEPLAALLQDMLMASLAAEALARIGGVRAYRALAETWLQGSEEVDGETLIGLLAHVLEGLARFPSPLPGLREALAGQLTTATGSVKVAAARSLLALGPGPEDAPALAALVEAQQEPTLLPACLSERQDLLGVLLAAEDCRRAWGLLLSARFPKAVPPEGLARALRGSLEESWLDLATRALTKLRGTAVTRALLDLYLTLSPAQRVLLTPALLAHRMALRPLLSEHPELTPTTRLVLTAMLGDDAGSLAAGLAALDDAGRVEALSQLLDREELLQKLPWHHWLEARPDLYAPLAAEAALGSGLRDLLPSLRRALDSSPTPELIRLLGELGDRDSVPRLVQLLEAGVTTYEPVLLESLGRIGGPEVRRALRAVSRDDDATRARIAFKALSLCAAEEDEAFFRESVGHLDWYVRLACAEVLGRFHRPENLAALAQLAADPVPIVSQRALAVLDPEVGSK